MTRPAWPRRLGLSLLLFYVAALGTAFLLLGWESVRPIREAARVGAPHMPRAQDLNRFAADFGCPGLLIQNGQLISEAFREIRNCRARQFKPLRFQP